MYAENKLFATLDAVSRRLALPGGGECLLVDTVGFVSKLPHELVEAFKSTLEEAALADLLVIVSDGSSEDMPAQRRVVEQVLAEIGAEGQPRLDVINKCDIAPREEEPLPRIPGALPISAKTGAGLDALLAAIAQRLRGQETEVTLLIPFARHGIISELRAKGRVTEERYEENGTRVRALLKREALGQITARYGDLIVPEQEEAR